MGETQKSRSSDDKKIGVSMFSAPGQGAEQSCHCFPQPPSSPSVIPSFTPSDSAADMWSYHPASPTGYPNPAAFRPPFQDARVAQSSPHLPHFSEDAAHHDTAYTHLKAEQVMPRSAAHPHFSGSITQDRDQCCSPSPVGSSSSFAPSGSLTTKSSQSSFQTASSPPGHSIESLTGVNRSLSPSPYNLRALGAQSPFNRCLPARPPSSRPLTPGGSMPPRGGARGLPSHVGSSKAPGSRPQSPLNTSRNQSARTRGISVTAAEQLLHAYLSQQQESRNPCASEFDRDPNAAAQQPWPESDVMVTVERYGGHPSSYKPPVQVSRTIDEVCHQSITSGVEYNILDASRCSVAKDDRYVCALPVCACRLPVLSDTILKQ